MKRYSLTHVQDSVLLRDLFQKVAQERVTTADVIALIAEVDARGLYARAGYSSMFAYCVNELHLSEDATAKRIQAARVARRFPALFTALADGRLHLTAISLLAPHVTAETVEELIEAATHRKKTEIEVLIARRFSAGASVQKPRLLTPISSRRPEQQVEAATATLDAFQQHATAHIGSERAPAHVETEHASKHEDEHAPAHVESESAHSPEWFLLQLMIDRKTRDKLQYAIALLSHAVPDGNAAQVLDRALDALIARLEKQRLGSIKPNTREEEARSSRRDGSTSARRHARGSVRPRYVPMQVRRAVWERDGGRCTFVSESGHRCNERRFLEFDHVDLVARGGRATVDRMRLRCRTHNQFEAERIFGRAFMSEKRMDARLSRKE